MCLESLAERSGDGRIQSAALTCERFQDALQQNGIVVAKNETKTSLTSHTQRNAIQCFSPRRSHSGGRA